MILLILLAISIQMHVKKNTVHRAPSAHSASSMSTVYWLYWERGKYTSKMAILHKNDLNDTLTSFSTTCYSQGCVFDTF